MSVVVELATLLGMLLSHSYPQLKGCGQAFLMAWMEEFFKENVFSYYNFPPFLIEIHVGLVSGKFCIILLSLSFFF